MNKIKLLLPLAAGALSLAAWPAYAHGFGERTELPVPLGYFLIGAAAAVAFSFVILAVFVKGTPGGSYWRYNLFAAPWLRAVLTSPLWLFPVKLLSVFLLGLAIATGFAGDQDPTINFAPTFVWVIWWVGMAFIVALFGNLWALLNPWKAVFEWAEWVYTKFRAGKPLSFGRYYPEGWGIWPGLVLFALFTWAQDAFPQSDLPSRLAVMAVVYSAVTLGGMALFGKHTWLRHGDAFSVVFRTWSKFSVTEARTLDTERCRTCSGQCLDRDGDCIDCYECFEGTDNRELNLRPFAVGLGRNEPVGTDMLALVVLLLATVTFDGFSATSAWVDFQTFVIDVFGGSRDGVFTSLTLADTLGVVLFPVGFFLVYMFFSQFMAGSSGGDLKVLEIAGIFAFSLVPIALAYNISHFITLLLIQGQFVVPLISDPFGFGWDIFGTVDYTLKLNIINARVLWFLSVALIVVGHITAVYLAHRMAVRMFQDRSSALASQYPMLTLMVIYTVVSLWIIAQPIVA